MHRIKQFKYWGRKKPTEANIIARGGRCLLDHWHRSQLEIKVCDELRLRRIARDIADFRIEVNIPLELDGCKLGTYRADFVVDHVDGSKEIIEAKGIFFSTFRQKWRIVEAMYRKDPNMKLTIITK